MSERKANLKGKIVGFADGKCLAIVKTDIGIAYLDIDDALDYRLQISDDIEVEDAGWYLKNGQTITILGDRYILNGRRHTISEISEYT